MSSVPKHKRKESSFQVFETAKKLRKELTTYILREEALQQYKSWIGTYHKKMSKQQIRNMEDLFASLYGEEEKKDE